MSCFASIFMTLRYFIYIVIKSFYRTGTSSATPLLKTDTFNVNETEKATLPKTIHVKGYSGDAVNIRNLFLEFKWKSLLCWDKPNELLICFNDKRASLFWVRDCWYSFYIFSLWLYLSTANEISQVFHFFLCPVTLAHIHIHSSHSHSAAPRFALWLLAPCLARWLPVKPLWRWEVESR